jgi:hypothetical protein
MDNEKFKMKNEKNLEQTSNEKSSRRSCKGAKPQRKLRDQYFRDFASLRENFFDGF